ncbi:unnamed protein product [Nesidiocoris tenuis]|uniref:Uncharacterized protein n=1 Tax=Nesidiocoris tenuis TaxID=355587 RepID=A0A6H5GAL9_9HEMI|nr:unnamed protein product [Nesidiocoris tenuis]
MTWFLSQESVDSSSILVYFTELVPMLLFSTDYKMDSDSSEECYDSYAASSEPINIQDVIMGDGDFTPLYLRYDSVINNALKSDESASAKPGNVKPSGVKEVVKEAESSAAPTSPSALSDDEELTVSVESCPTQASDAQTETPSSAQETMTPGQGKEWNTVRMSDCFVKVEKIQVQRDENDPTKVSGSPIEQTAPNVSSFEDQHNKLSQESSVTHSSSDPSSSAKPGPRGPVRRRAAPAQNSGKKMTSVSKTEENPGNIELADDEWGEKSKFTDRNVEIEPEKTSERRLSAEMVQARLSKEISVSQVQSVVHGASVVSSGQIADKRAGGGEMRSYNVSITPVIKKMDTSSPRSCELSADQSTVDEIQSEILEAMKVDPHGEDKSAHLPESVDTVAEKCVALSRPRRQTRAPKRIADAIKPKVNSRNSPASKAPPSAKANLSTLIEGKTSGQSKVTARTGEDRKKMKKLLSSNEHQSVETPIAEPKFLPSPSSEASSIGPAVNVPTGSAVAETAVSPAPLTHPQLPPPVEIPAKLESTEPDVRKSAPSSAISTITPAEGNMITISSKPTKATLPAKLDDVADNSKPSDVLSLEAGSNDRLVELPAESLKSGIEPSNIAAGCAQETSAPTVGHPAEPPESTRLSDVIEKPPVDNRVPESVADTPQVCDASSIRSAESVTTLAASALSSCSAPIIDDSSCKKDTDLKTLVPKANISENVKSSAAHSGFFKDNPLECLDLKNTDSQKPGLEPSGVGGNITSGSIAAAEVPESTIVKGTFQEIPQTVVAPDNMEAVTKTQAALKEKSSESSNSPAATIKEQGQEPPMPQLPAIKEKRSATPQTGIPKDKKKSVPFASPPVLPKEKSLESTTISAIKENKLGTQLAQTGSVKEKSVPHKQGIGLTAVVDTQGKSDLLPKSAPKTSGPEAIASAKSQPVKPAPSLRDPRSLTPKPSICKNPGTPDAPALGKVLVSSPQTIAKLKDNTPQQPDPASAQSQPSAQKPASDLVQKVSTNLPKLTEVDIFNVATSPVKPLAAHAKKGLGSAKTAATPKSNDPPSKSFPAKPAEASANPDTPAFKTHPSIPKSPQTLPKSPVTPRPSPTTSKSSGAQPESDLPSSLAAEATPATAGVDAGVPVKVQTASLSLEVPASPKTEHPAAPKPVESPKTSPSKAHSSTKVVSASKASSPKVSSAPKSTGPRVATKAALKSFAAPKAQQSTKAAAKPPPQKSTKSAKAATPKGAKGIAKATAKLAMAQEVSSKVDQGSALADSKSEPDVKSPAAEFEAVRSAAKVGATKEEPAKATKTSKVETKKEKEAAKKVEGSTRRRSNRIRVNRWDEGPNIAAAAAASAAAAINSGQAETVSVNNPAAQSSMTAASQVSSKSVDSSANLLPPPPPPASGFEADKPVKVKSRWRRTSELEMGSRTSAHDPGAAIPTSPAPAGMSPSSPSPAPPPPPPSEPPPASSANSPTRPSSADLPLSAAADQVPFKAPLPVYDFDHPEIAERMKQFDVIRESIYLTERLVPVVF